LKITNSVAAFGLITRLRLYLPKIGNFGHLFRPHLQ